MDNIFEIDGEVLKHCTVNQPHVVIPDSVTTIAQYAFGDKDNELNGQDALVSVVMPVNVTKIDSYAFYDCRNLESVTILGAAEIGFEAFFGCKKLYDVYLADGVKQLESECFAYCENLDSLFIPASVEYILYGNIACQNGHQYKNPYFFCERLGRGRCWNEEWNRIYKDPRFNDHEHSSYHPVFYGLTRSGFTRAAVESIRALRQSVPSTSDDPCATAHKLICHNRWADAFDLIYSPTVPDDKHRYSLLLRFCAFSIAINALQPDQVERIKNDSQQPDNAMSKYLYGYWLMWNITDIGQLKETEELLVAAGENGIADSWWKLQYMWTYGFNQITRIDNEKADTYIQKALQGNSFYAFIDITVQELIDNNKFQEAIDLLNQRTADEDGEKWVNPYIFIKLSECYYNLGDNVKAEEMARKSITLGALDGGYRKLINTICFDADGNLLPEGEKLMDSLFKEASDAGSAYGMMSYASILKDQLESMTGDERKLLEMKIRVLYEKSALLGNGDACWELAHAANNGELAFYRENPIDAYPFFLRGAIVGNVDCAYWLYMMQSVASIQDIDCTEREFNLPYRHRLTSPEQWKSLAMAYYEAQGLEWPKDDE